MRAPISMLRERYAVLRLVRTPDGRGGYTKAWVEDERYVPGKMTGILPTESWAEYDIVGDQVRHRMLARVLLSRAHVAAITSEDRIRREAEEKEWDIIAVAEEDDVYILTVRDFVHDQPV